MFKKTLPLVVLSLLASFCFVNAQDNDQNHNFPRKYRNIGFVSQKITFDDNDFDDFNLKSKIGAAITVGRTYYVHPKPLANMIKFGIDATFFDANYGNYSQKYYEDYETYKVKYHQADIGLQVGPSVMVNPVAKLNVAAYFRYAPTFSLLYVSEDSDVYGNYASFFVAGGAVTYGRIGLGVEARWGKGDYKRFGGDDDDYDYDSDDYYSPSKVKLKTSGVRVYLSFRF